MLVAALLSLGATPSVAAATSAPAPVATSTASPPPTARQPHPVVDLEAGGANSWLNAGKGRWESAYLGATYATPSGFRLYSTAQNDVRFGSSQDVYVLGTSIPTKQPHGTLDVGHAFSPRSDVLPTNAWFANYDLRTGGGYGYQIGYVGRSFASGTAADYSLGMDRHFSDQRLGYFIAFSTLSRKSGIGVLQGLRWSKYLPMDNVTVTPAVGRSVESTGKNKVAFHDVVGASVDELHWLDSQTAIRFDTGYYSVSRAYQRFFALLGLRVRL